MVKLLLSPPNLMLLDEPTTHLDMPSIDAVIQALKDYTGTLIFVSHDLHFIRALAKRTVRIEAGKITNFAGDYDYYLWKSGAISEKKGLVEGLKDSRPTDFTNDSKKTKVLSAKEKEESVQKLTKKQPVRKNNLNSLSINWKRKFSNLKKNKLT